MTIIQASDTAGFGGYFVGFLGAGRRGSDPRALAAALRQMGHVVAERNVDEYAPQNWRNPVLKVARRLLGPCVRADYNKAVLELVSHPVDFLLVFKGQLLRLRTLERFREAGIPCYLFYPDVSFFDHGRDIPACLPLYDCVFTTKSFHIESPPAQLTGRSLVLVNHGADPDVHRPVECTDAAVAPFRSDVAFVGCWSAKKERFLRMLVERCPECEVGLWGTGWERACAAVRKAWRGRGAWGDELALIYRYARINLGLLSEAGGGTIRGDQTTARTWQIPAAGGFLLHERTDEFLRYFEPGVEAAVFDNPNEMVAQINHYLANPQEREAVRVAGWQRFCRSGYTYLPAAQQILAYHAARMASRSTR